MKDASMKSTFVRGLWGDASLEGTPLGKVCPQILHLFNKRRGGYNPSPCVWYVFGEKNAELLEPYNENVVLLSDEGLVNLTEAPGEQNPEQGGRWNWGVMHWLHKLHIWRRALDDYDEIIWLDTDVRQMRKLPGDFWERMRKGPRLKAILRQYLYRKCLWRSRGRRYNAQNVFAAFVYLRSKQIADRLIELHAVEPRNGAEIPMCRWIEEQMGPWTEESPERYRELGYCPDWAMLTRSGVFKPETDKALFRNLGTKA